MKKLLLLSLMMLSFLLTGCTDETMEKLKSDTFDPNLTTAFWTEEIRDNSDLWQQALPYCQSMPGKVNCIAVREAWRQYNVGQFVAARQAIRPAGGPLARRRHVIVVN